MRMMIRVTTELAIIFPNKSRLKLRCSVINKQLLWIIIRNKEKVIKDLLPIFFKVISSVSASILCGIVILLISGFTKAMRTVAVE
jgi:hypothetical protein